LSSCLHLELPLSSCPLMLELEVVHRSNLFVPLGLAEHKAPCYLILPEAILLLVPMIIFPTSLFGFQILIYHKKRHVSPFFSFNLSSELWRELTLHTTLSIILFEMCQSLHIIKTHSIRNVFCWYLYSQQQD